MNKTKLLYECDGHLCDFLSTVLSCEKTDAGYLTVLSETAFFPEGGGQAADRGSIDGVNVLDVQIKDGVVTHTLDRPLQVGSQVRGKVDFGLRRARMQCHTAEHIVSGIVHKLYGFDNVGFHLGDDVVTVDFNGVLSREQLIEIEILANDAVYRNLPVEISYPKSDELPFLKYRSKLELTENVRIVSIDGVDACACCAPHVKMTGEVGEIKILDFIKYKGGIRLEMLAGERARLDHESRYTLTAEVSRLLSVKQNEIGDGVRRLLDAEERAKAVLRSLSARLVDAIASSLSPCEGNLLIFEPLADGEMLRELVNRAVSLAGGAVIALSGNDADGYRYVIGSEALPLRVLSREYHTALNGKGGGTDRMIQGTLHAPLSRIREYFS